MPGGCARATGGRDSKLVQRGGFASEQDASEALERSLEKLRCANGSGRTRTLAELVEEYLTQHDAAPVTVEKLGWLLTKAVRPSAISGSASCAPEEIAAWRMTIPPGYRFEATTPQVVPHNRRPQARTYGNGRSEMRVLLSTYGARGDAEVIMGLAVQLRALGAEGCDALVATGVIPAGVWL